MVLIKVGDPKAIGRVDYFVVSVGSCLRHARQGGLNWRGWWRARIRFGSVFNKHTSRNVAKSRSKSGWPTQLGRRGALRWVTDSRDRVSRDRAQPNTQPRERRAPAESQSQLRSRSSTTGFYPMSVPPFTRSTRSSNTPKSPPPGSSSSRTARPSSLAVDSLSTRLSSSTQTRRTGLTTSTTSVSTTLPKPRLPTRSSASTAPSVSAPRPLWGSSRQNTDDSARPRTATAPVKHPTGVRRPVTGTGSTRTSLAVPNGSGARAASRAGSVVGRESVAVTPATPVKNEAVDKGGVEKYDPTREPIKVSTGVSDWRMWVGGSGWLTCSWLLRSQAYLRLRPAPSSADQAGQDHIRVLSNTELLMVQPQVSNHHQYKRRPIFNLTPHALTATLRSALWQDHRLGSAASSFSLSTQAHPSAPSDSLAPGQPAPSPQGTLYKFTAIADPTAANAQTAQADFFRATTLPLVNDFVNGENCLLFAYGSTGSGKTWTVQGGEGENAGLLPRTLDVVLRSLQGKHTRANVSQTKSAQPG